MSASDLANKYGYLLLLCNMASKTVYGFFHLQNPQANETIIAGTASSWANNHPSFSPSNGNYTPTLTEPEKPTPPMYEVVPVVPEEPVKPVPPVKPVYEPLNEITLLKVDKEDEQPLANAVFQLANKVTGEKLDTFTTASDGQLTIKNIAPGHYTLTEIQAPDGYILDSTPLDFVITGAENETVRLEKKNIPITGSVELTKLDGKTNQVLQGAVFELRDQNGKTIKNEVATDETGRIFLDDLVPGTYQFVEVQAPTGYKLDQTPLNFSIKKGQKETVRLTMTNQLLPGEVILTKRDQTTGQTLQDAVFELKNKTGKIVKKDLVTDDSGKLSIDNLAPGDYQFIETQAPTGYKLDPTPITFTIEKNQKEAVQVRATNEMITGGVILEKIDDQTGKKLNGAEFELQTNYGKQLMTHLVTDDSGRLAIENLKSGTYQLIETKAPDGYQLDKKPLRFSVQKNQKAAQKLTKMNKQAKHVVRLEKKDGQTKQFLQGAAFQLLDQAGKIVKKHLEMTKNGTLEVDGLANGSYKLIEIKAPSGYQLEDKPVLFTLNRESSLLTIDIYNYQNDRTNFHDGITASRTDSSVDHVKKKRQHHGNGPATYFPKTGEKQSNVLTVWGVIFICLSFFLLFLRQLFYKKVDRY